MKIIAFFMAMFLMACGAQDYAHNAEMQPVSKKHATTQVANYVEGQLLVVFARSVKDVEARQRIAKHGGVIVRVIPEQYLYQVQLPKGVEASDAISEYQNIEGVSHVELNYKRTLR